MNRKEFKTGSGTIIYWINEIRSDRQTLVFLPGLTATHILFDKQLEYFEDKYNCLVWDAPGHGESKPFELNFSLEKKAQWLHDILEKENIQKPILAGQSMGGYVSQWFIELYPHECRGFISIDSCSLKRKYVTGFEIWALKNVGPIYRMYPWEALKKAGSKGCAETEYGAGVMRRIMDGYDKDSYCSLAAHGYKILAEAYESGRAFDITCPALLLCGDKDKAGSAKRYNIKWQKDTGLPLHWIENAGHNSNTDRPDVVNKLIEEFAGGIAAQ